MGVSSLLGHDQIYLMTDILQKMKFIDFGRFKARKDNLAITHDVHFPLTDIRDQNIPFPQ